MNVVPNRKSYGKKIFFTIVLIQLFLYSYSWSGIGFKKITELKFDYYVSVFAMDNHLVILDGEKSRLLVYRDNRLEKNERVSWGKGPGDFLSISNIIGDSSSFIVWDRLESRFTYLTREWELMKIEKYAGLGFGKPLVRTSDGFIFKWNKMLKSKKGAMIVRNIGLVNRRGIKKIYCQEKGLFNYRGKLNYNRPLLLSGYGAGKIIYAFNNEYKIYSLDPGPGRMKTRLLVESGDQEKIRWNDFYARLEMDILGEKHASRKRMLYPGYLPPLFNLITHSDSELVGVVTNARIKKKQTLVDFYSANGKKLGELILPLIYNQYFVFNHDFMFADTIVLARDRVYALCPQNEIFKVFGYLIERE